MAQNFCRILNTQLSFYDLPDSGNYSATYSSPVLRNDRVAILSDPSHLYRPYTYFRYVNGSVNSSSSAITPVTTATYNNFVVLDSNFSYYFDLNPMFSSIPQTFSLQSFPIPSSTSSSTDKLLSSGIYRLYLQGGDGGNTTGTSWTSGSNYARYFAIVVSIPLTLAIHCNVGFNGSSAGNATSYTSNSYYHVTTGRGGGASGGSTFVSVTGTSTSNSIPYWEVPGGTGGNGSTAQAWVTDVFNGTDATATSAVGSGGTSVNAISATPGTPSYSESTGYGAAAIAGCYGASLSQSPAYYSGDVGNDVTVGGFGHISPGYGHGVTGGGFNKTCKPEGSGSATDASASGGTGFPDWSSSALRRRSWNNGGGATGSVYACGTLNYAIVCGMDGGSGYASNTSGNGTISLLYGPLGAAIT